MHTTDDRGRRVPLAWRAIEQGLLDALRAHRPLPGDRRPLAGLRRAWRLATNPHVLATALALILVGIIASLLATQGPVGLGLLLLTPVATPLLISLFRGGRAALDVPRALAGVCERALLARAACPTCTYSLSGLDEHPDGCVVCPECAAAWSAHAISTPAHDRVVVVASTAGDHAPRTPELPST